jgi:hypothetical protein
MATIACKQFLNELDSWMEGDRKAKARAHLAQCRNCRALIEDLDAIRVSAREFKVEAVEPPAHLWNSIRVQLEAEGLIRDRHAVVPFVNKERRRWTAWFGAWPRPALAGAYLTILIVAGFALSHPLNKRVNDYRWMRRTQNSTTILGAHLDSVEHNTVAALASDRAVTAVLSKNLAIVDNYISLCEKSVRENPESEMARDYLYDAYQQKADLLAQINERGE